MTPFVADREYPVIGDLAEFDRASGSWLERLLFNHRLAILAGCCVATVVLGWQSFGLTLNASFDRMIPAGHPYIENYLRHRSDLGALENTLRLAVEAKAGSSVFDAEYLETLRRINDEVFLLPGVDRPYMKSLWTPATRWIGVTEEGMDGGTVIPEDYDGSADSLVKVRRNLERSGEIGQLVAFDARSSVILVPMREVDAATGQRLDYGQLSRRLEGLRARYQAEGVTLHITGFAKVVGDLIDGLRRMTIFFALAVAVAAVFPLAYTRCARSALLVVGCSLTAVVWLLGTLAVLGYDLDPYSSLVPFLVFAIGMSHGAQKMNGIRQDIGRGTHRLVAARYTFRRLFLAGLTALLADAVGFAVLKIVPIAIIRDLAVTASLGVAILIFTNLALLPILLSFTGVSPRAARDAIRGDGRARVAQGVRRFLERFARRGWADLAIGIAVALGVAGFGLGLHRKIGDLEAGAPELRPGSAYNRDHTFMTTHFGAGGDLYVVMVETPVGGCNQQSTIAAVDALEARLRLLANVDSTQSLADLSKILSVAQNEGNAKWWDVPRDQNMLGFVVSRSPRHLFNPTCDLLMVNVFLKDHTADTIGAVSRAVEDFARANDTADVRFLLAAGSAGIEAATNDVVAAVDREMLVTVYLAVASLCLIALRSWRAVACALPPLMLTSLLCEGLMVVLGIGVKVATLPVIALGVGIGVDYTLYILSVVMARLRLGEDLPTAYGHALRFTGGVVVLTGLTLGAGVATWTFSPIKFQADMGLLLAFMFLWNMIGALVLVPALACFLLRPEARRRAALTDVSL